MPPYPYHSLVALIAEHRREVYPTRPRPELVDRTRRRATVVGCRTLLVRVLNRVVGPR